jgi:chromosome partitioning protein
MMRKIVLMQQKGGASKSSLCVHLAVASEQAGYKTAVIDTDPQGSASAVWGAARGDVAPPVAAVIAAELKDALDAAEADGYRVIFIDTPPHTAPAIERVVKLSIWPSCRFSRRSLTSPPPRTLLTFCAQPRSQQSPS